MKKILLITVLSIFMASSAFATGTLAFPTLDKANTGKSLYGDPADAATATAALIGKTSSGVGTAIFTTALGYGAMTQHTNGTKAFGSSHDSTSIYSIIVTTGTATTAPAAIGVVTFGAGWTAM